MTQPLNILVTGQLRTPDRIERSLRDWATLRESGVLGRVVVVTWTSETDEHPEYADRLKEAGCELLVHPDPRVRGIGHIWPQTLALDLGLRAFGDQDLVLKTRTDLWIDPDLLMSFADPEFLEPSADRPQILSRRVWVPWMELTKPFYLADECFLGAAPDLRSLVNYDESYSLLWDIGCGVTHIRRFLPAFRAGYPIFEQFLERYTNVHHFEDTRWNHLRSMLADDSFLEVLAAYYDVMRAHFRVGSPDGSIEFRDWSSGTPQPSPAMPMHRAFESSQSGLEGAHLVFAHSESWLEACLDGKLPADELGERFQQALERVRRTDIIPPARAI